MGDINQTLKDTENSLRDFIQNVLQNKIGEKWLEKSGVTPERIIKWNEKKETESKRQRLGSANENLLYYSDLTDLRTIILKNWDPTFKEIFNDKKEFEVYFDKLETFRIADAHGRELLPHQKSLLRGLTGEIRTRIIKNRNKMSRINEVFPRIEFVRDDLGNKCEGGGVVKTGMELNPGDRINFVVTAYDPEDLDLKFSVHKIGNYEIEWIDNNSLSIIILEEDITKIFIVEILIKSTRAYHANTYFDDKSQFIYSVLPK